MSKNLDWQFWTTFILALIGALAWTPIVYNWFQKCEINGKILSNYGNLAQVPNETNLQSLYVQKIALFSQNKDFFPKDITVFIKYPSLQNELECTLWTWRNLIFTFNENGENIQKKLNINLSDYLIHKIVYQRNETIVGYISFSVNHQIDEMFEYVRFEFIDYKEKIKNLKIMHYEIDANKLAHENDIWIDNN